jgi:hypothetical protein
MTLVMKAFQELTAVDSVAAGAADYSEYRVADPDLFPSDTTNTGFGTLVRMKDAGGSVLLAVVIGKSVPGNAQLRYVRRVDSDDVFTAAISAELISTSMKDWADRNLLKIDPTRIKQVRILNALVDASRGQYLPQCRMIWEHDDEADPEWSLVWLEEFHGQKWKPVTLDNEAELDIASLGALKKTLATLEPVELIRKTPALSKSLSATGTWNTQDAEELRALQEQGFYVVQQSNELQLLAQEGQIRVLIEDGVEYLLRFGRSVGASGDRCLFVTARFNHGLDLRAEPSAEESRPKPEQLGAGEERVRELNGQFGHWFYVISDDSFRKLRPGLGDIAPAK